MTNPLIASLEECGFSGENRYSNQGWYDNVVAVDPVDPNRVWMGGIDLFRSEDGGLSWGLASYWWLEPNKAFVHADQHAIVFYLDYNGTSNRTIFIGNDGGIYRGTNARSATSRGETGIWLVPFFVPPLAFR